LTPREREVLQMVAEGRTTKEIAWALAVTIKTVHFHRRSLEEKLGLVRDAELVKYALRHGLTTAARE
jgi:DNA-binding CsgD family transcriptional regulator